MSDLGYTSLDPVLSAHATVQQRTRTHINASARHAIIYTVPTQARNRYQRAQLEKLELNAPGTVSWSQRNGAYASAARQRAAVSACVRSQQTCSGFDPCNALC